jgi:Fe-S-cluster-containing dehydrogenase component
MNFCSDVYMLIEDPENSGLLQIRRQPNPKADGLKMIYIDNDKCDGCKVCMDACSQHVDHPGISVIFAENINNVSTAITCMHCADAPCAKSCPAEAIKIRNNGIVLAPSEVLCVACNNCVIACPFGVMQLRVEDKLAVKCDTCSYRLEAGELPLCISACPSKAISLESPSKVAFNIRGAAARRMG